MDGYFFQLTPNSISDIQNTVGNNFGKNIENNFTQLFKLYHGILSKSRDNLKKLRNFINPFINQTHDFIKDTTETNKLIFELTNPKITYGGSEKFQNIHKLLDRYSDLTGVIKQLQENNINDEYNPFNRKKQLYHKVFTSNELGIRVVYITFESDPIHIKTWLHVIYSMTKIFQKINPQLAHLASKLTLYILDLDTPRSLPSSPDKNGFDKYCFDSSSGLTYQSTIIVGKRDDMIRLIIHELAHYFRISHGEDLDTIKQKEFKNGDSIDTLLRELPTQFNIPRNNYFESTTEALSVVLMYLYMSFFRSINPLYKPTYFKKQLNENDAIDNIIDLLSFEIHFDFKQIAKLILFFEQNPVKYKLSTQYYSYVYLRILHLMTLNQFIPNILSGNMERYIPKVSQELIDNFLKGLRYWRGKLTPDVLENDKSLRFTLIDFYLVKK